MPPGQKLEKGIAVEEERVEGAEGAAVVGEPEKCNTVTFVGADGME